MRKSKKYIAIALAILLLILSVFSAYSAPAPTQIHMSVLGDSIASGYGLEDIYNSYSALIAKEKHYALSNDAVPGHTTADLLWVVCHDEIARQGLEVADLVIISIGGNDILRLLGDSDTAVLIDIMSNGTNSEYVRKAVDNAKEKLLFSCMEIRSLNPDVSIILQTQYNPLYAHEQYKQLAPLADTLSPIFTDIIAHVSDQLDNIRVADIYTAFDNYYKEMQDYNIIQSDGIHPSEQGHALIAQVILKEIATLEEEGLVPKAASQYYLLGDPDASGRVTISDATLIQKYLAKLVVFKDGVVRLCADTDADGIVTVRDATAIQKYLAGLTPESQINTLIP